MMKPEILQDDDRATRVRNRISKKIRALDEDDGDILPVDDQIEQEIQSSPCDDYKSEDAAAEMDGADSGNSVKSRENALQPLFGDEVNEIKSALPALLRVALHLTGRHCNHRGAFHIRKDSAAGACDQLSSGTVRSCCVRLQEKNSGKQVYLSAATCSTVTISNLNLQKAILSQLQNRRQIRDCRYDGFGCFKKKLGVCKIGSVYYSASTE
jgi:hypothetical protein